MCCRQNVCICDLNAFLIRSVNNMHRSEAEAEESRKKHMIEIKDWEGTFVFSCRCWAFLEFMHVRTWANISVWFVSLVAVLHVCATFAILFLHAWCLEGGPAAHPFFSLPCSWCRACFSLKSPQALHSRFLYVFFCPGLICYIFVSGHGFHRLRPLAAELY